MSGRLAGSIVEPLLFLVMDITGYDSAFFCPLASKQVLPRVLAAVKRQWPHLEVAGSETKEIWSEQLPTESEIEGMTGLLVVTRDPQMSKVFDDEGGLPQKPVPQVMRVRFG